jgi:hypothetical protein
MCSKFAFSPYLAVSFLSLFMNGSSIWCSILSAAYVLFFLLLLDSLWFILCVVLGLTIEIYFSPVYEF